MPPPGQEDPQSAFIEQMGLLAEKSGMSRIAGRLIALLIVDGREHSLDDLAESLQVSKASISTNARFLQERGLLERASRPGDRRDYYRVGDNPWEQLFAVASAQLKESKRLFEATHASFPPEHEDARRRLAAWASFYAFLLDDFDRRVARWREQQAG